MSYFLKDDIRALQDGDAQATRDRVRQQFYDLHEKVYKQINVLDIDLSIIKPSSQVIQQETVSQHNEHNLFAVQYLRSRGQAVAIERLMGREEVASLNNIITRLHPVIEIRLSEAGLTLELIIAPDAWWDQQNVNGKLSIPHHRQGFYRLLQELDARYCMGFWQGIHLSEMHLKGRYFQHPRILDEWLSTFEPRADWFRIGIWYAFDEDALAPDHIVSELVAQVQALYAFYTYFLWTSDNNFRDFSESTL
ncbi:MAG: hypothetical protein ACFE0Q_14910 [Anaerolineae bacterium]